MRSGVLFEKDRVCYFDNVWAWRAFSVLSTGRGSKRKIPDKWGEIPAKNACFIIGLMDFRFTTEYPLSRLDEIVSYLLGPRLWIPQTDYPDFSDWAQKSHQEIKRESKRALIALSRQEIVGVAIYQRHKKIKETLEVKNLTVRPDQRGRYIASFLMRNAEVEGARDFKATKVVCDAKANNFSVQSFLVRHHYSILDKTDLYQLGTGEDLVYQKILLPSIQRI